MLTSLPIVLFAFLFLRTAALPHRRSGVTILTAAQISSYQPYTLFARAAYCPPSETATWSCGTNCDSIPGFVPFASGGDGGDTQYWYVGYDPATLKSAVVAHQGTDTSNFLADLTDANIVLQPLDQTLFPGVPSTLLAHSGFLESHARSAPDILAAVQSVIATAGTTSVTIVGHSLGGALAELDAIYLPLHLPSTIAFTTVTYGTPRVGNPAFAGYVDANANFVHINNKKDPVPILPFQSMGFQQVEGQKHIVEVGDWVACDGDENTDPQCTDGEVPTVAESDPNDHDGYAA